MFERQSQKFTHEIRRKQTKAKLNIASQKGDVWHLKSWN